MCGIVAVLGRSEATLRLIDALRKLEYRGYDSAGVATLVNDSIERRRAEGKLGNLAALLARQPIAGTTGLGLTRRATHGAPSENNAHPIAAAADRRRLIDGAMHLIEPERKSHMSVSPIGGEVPAA